MSPLRIKFWFITAILLSGTIRGYGQNELPEVFKKGTISEQFKYLDERTRIYDDFRAIREDMFRVISRNTLDTLKNTRKKMNDQISQTTTLNNRIDSLKNSLEASKSALEEMTRTKESIPVLGIEVNKKSYNAIMWTILGVLVFLLISGFLIFRQNRHITHRTKLDLVELKEEFEGYRQKARLDREQMTRDHFNEIKRLKGR